MLGLLKRIRNHDKDELTGVESIADTGAYLSISFGIITCIVAAAVLDCLIRSLAADGYRVTQKIADKKPFVVPRWYVPMKILPVVVNAPGIPVNRRIGRQPVWTGRNYKKMH